MNKEQKEFFLEIMDLYEFEVYENDKGKLQVRDLQGACLGDICYEHFKDEFEIIDRMEIYHQDYILRVVEDEYDVHFSNYEGWYNFLKKENPEHYLFELNLLSLILFKKLYNEDDDNA